MVLNFFVEASKICIEIETYCTYLHFSFTILKYKISYSSQKSLTLKRNSAVVTQDLFIVKTDAYNNYGLKYLISNVKVDDQFVKVRQSRKQIMVSSILLRNIHFWEN